MKWAICLAGLAASYPLGRVLRQQRWLQALAWTLVGLLPFLGSLDIGLILDTTFVGDSHGIEVSVIDLLALSLVFARQFSFRRVPYRVPLGLYLLVAAVSVAQAAAPVQAVYYVWKLLRGYLLFVSVVRAAGSIPVSLAILRGMALGIFYDFYLVMQQRFAAFASPGSFAHQNSLGMAVNLFLVTAVALVLARRSGWLMTLSPAVGLVVVLLTRSRGALIFFVLGVVLVFTLSLIKRFTGRKVLIVVVGGVITLGALTRAVDRVVERFEQAPESSMETRRQLVEAAALMLRDHPMGVGGNHFSWSLRAGGYAERVGLMSGTRYMTVHNIYWLTAAEFGYLGIVALAVLFLVPLTDAMRFAFMAESRDVRGDLLLGLGISLLVFSLHSTLEFVWRITEVAYVFWILVALVGALAAAVRTETLIP